MTTESKVNKEQEEKIEISPYLKEYSELPPESLGTYLLNYLEELKLGNKEENNQLHDRDELIHLLLLFKAKVKKLQTNSMKSKKLRGDLDSQFKVLARKFNDIFFPSPPSKPPQQVIVHNGRRTSLTGNCVGCSILLKYGWKYQSNIGVIYFCISCEEEFLGSKGTKYVDMWSKMVFSSFETNRRKH